MKRAKSLSEGAQEIEEGRSKRRRATIVVEVSDWVFVETTTTHRWAIQEPQCQFPGAVLSGFARNPSIIEIFLNLFNDTVVGSL